MSVQVRYPRSRGELPGSKQGAIYGLRYYWTTDNYFIIGHHNREWTVRVSSVCDVERPALYAACVDIDLNNGRWKTRRELLQVLQSLMEETE